MGKTRNKLTAIDAIRNFYLDERGRITLTEQQETIRLRLVSAHGMMCSFKSPRLAQKKHQKRFELSDVQAWRDIRDAITLFGDVQKAEKEGMRYIILEYQIETFRMARDKKDLAVMERSAASMAKLLGLDKESADLPDFEKIKPAMIVLGLLPEQEKRLDTLMSGGVFNFSKNQPPVFEEIEIEPTNDEEE